MDERTGRVFKDRQMIIYINSRMRTETELGRLMHDFHCENPDDMYCEEIADSEQHLKDYIKYWKNSGVDEIFITALWTSDELSL